MILYYFCTCKILLFIGATGALAQAGITSNQIFFAAQAVAQIALAIIFSLPQFASLPGHPLLECMSGIWTEEVDKSCITKK